MKFGDISLSSSYLFTSFSPPLPFHFALPSLSFYSSSYIISLSLYPLSLVFSHLSPSLFDPSLLVFSPPILSSSPSYVVGNGPTKDWRCDRVSAYEPTSSEGNGILGLYHHGQAPRRSHWLSYELTIVAHATRVWQIMLEWLLMRAIDKLYTNVSIPTPNPSRSLVLLCGCKCLLFIQPHTQHGIQIETSSLEMVMEPRYNRHYFS